MSIKNLLCFIGLMVVLSSCSLAYRVLLGVDTSPQWKSDQQIIRQAKKYKIPLAYNLVMDTASYFHALKDIYTAAIRSEIDYRNDSSSVYNLKKALNDDQQPVQFRLFDSTGTEIFKLVNCYIDPPIPLNWNVGCCFNSFPPQTSFEALRVHQYNLNFLLSHTRSLNQSNVAFDNLPKADYYGVIVWNDFFKRPSKRLIETVRKYIADNDKHVFMIYINNHNQQIWPMLDFETKQEIVRYYYPSK